MKGLNFKILAKNLKRFRFAAVRFGYDNQVIGINCGIINFIPVPDHETNIIGYYEIGFHQYISIKKPFIIIK